MKSHLSKTSVSTKSDSAMRRTQLKNNPSRFKSQKSTLSSKSWMKWRPKRWAILKTVSWKSKYCYFTARSWCWSRKAARSATNKGSQPKRYKSSLCRTTSTTRRKLRCWKRFRFCSNRWKFLCSSTAATQSSAIATTPTNNANHLPKLSPSFSQRSTTISFNSQTLSRKNTNSLGPLRLMN